MASFIFSIFIYTPSAHRAETFLSYEAKEYFRYGYEVAVDIWERRHICIFLSVARSRPPGRNRSGM